MTARRPLSNLAVLLLLTWAVPCGHSGDKQTADQHKGAAKATLLPSDPALNVGADTCKICHQFETVANFVITMEGKLERWKGQGCEACHGPGKEHVDGGGDKTKIFAFKDTTPQEASGRCLRCHQYTEEHGNYARSMHLANGIGRLDCHCPHHAKESQFLMKAKSPGVSGLVQQASPYSSHVNTGFLDLLWTPVKRFSTPVGANLSGVTGNQLNVNPLSPIALAPAGPLNSNWYQPCGAVSYPFTEQWTGRARWDYYGYYEGSYQDLSRPGISTAT